MSHKALAVVLELIDVLSVVACLVIAIGVVPGAESAGSVPAGSTVVFCIGIIPLIVLAVYGMSLFSAIGKGDVFVRENARRLKRMGAASAVSAAVWVVGIIACVICGYADEYLSSIGTLSVALVFTVALCVVCFALALLTERASDIKSENDMTV